MLPSSDEIRAQLDRVLASDEFANADRMSAFLRYVVERSLAGEADQIKEYTIGVDVFGRDGDYDPRLDSIVRVEARRLRAKVDDYYAAHADPVIIRIRRGSYVPSFERRAGLEEPASKAPDSVAADSTTASASRRTAPSAWLIGAAVLAGALLLVAVVASRDKLWGVDARPEITIVVLPFAQYSTDDAERLLAARLTDGVTSELARNRSLGVVSHTSALQFAESHRPLEEIGKALNANVVVEGRVSRSGDRVSVSIRLVNAGTNRKFWVQDFEGSVGDPREIERRIAAAVAPKLLTSGRK